MKHEQQFLNDLLWTMTSLQSGKLVAVDVQSEYVLFLRLQAGSMDE